MIHSETVKEHLMANMERNPLEQMTHLGSGNLPPNESEVAEFGNETSFKRKPRFTSLRGVRREMGALYMDLMHGRVSQKVAGTANGILCGIAKTLEAETLERRLADLEQRVGVSDSPRASRGLTRGVVGHA
jgi:hypothetical protein